MSMPDKPATGTRHSPGAFDDQHVDHRDDMYEPEEALQGESLLPAGLRVLEKYVIQPYWCCNWQALEQQKKHQRITRWALLTGMLAVVLAILQFASDEFSWYLVEQSLAVAEAFCAVAAGILVITGLVQAIQQEWLLQRHKAERFRLLKYGAMLDLAKAGGEKAGLQHWSEKVKSDAEDILNIEREEMDRWANEGPRSPLRGGAAEKDKHEVASEFEQIVECYRNKRLEKQLNYFFGRAEKALKSDSATKYLPPVLFALSLSFAIAHALIHGALLIGHWEVWWEKPLTVILITLAAVLPVVGATIRTHRSANEFGRNTVRFRSVYQKLLQVEDSFSYEMEPAARLALLKQAEQTLEDEHCEWLRLMDEAEWYG